MNINYLDTYLRKHTELENSPMTTIQVKENWETIHNFSIRYINNKQFLGGITVIKQDRFLAVPEHRHEWFELAYMYSGQITITVESAPVHLKQGQCILINCNAAHSCGECGEDDILINFLILPQYLNQNFFSRFSNSGYLSQYLIRALNNQNSKHNYIHFHSENSRRLPVFFREFLCEYYDCGIYAKDYIDSFTTLIFLELTNTYRLDSDGKHPGRRDLLPILRYIEENFRTCTLETTAAFFHMNPNYLSNYIKKQSGANFLSIVQNQRMRYAAKLLENTNLPVTEIAEKAGYQNVSFFYKKFKEIFRCMPAEYRAERG